MSNVDQVARRLSLTWDDQRQTWVSPVRGIIATPYRMLLAAAVDCARPIIEDGAAADEELTELLPIAQTALTMPGNVAMTDEEIEALARVAELGAEYMQNNRYEDDPDFPEDAHIAKQIAGMSAREFTSGLTHTFQRRWHDDPTKGI